jgi:hypothetical protein
MFYCCYYFIPENNSLNEEKILMLGEVYEDVCVWGGGEREKE